MLQRRTKSYALKSNINFCNHSKDKMPSCLCEGLLKTMVLVNSTASLGDNPVLCFSFSTA